jgi:hypothetical protein
MSELCAVKDLAVGDVIQVAGFDDNLTVRSTRKINKGMDTGKLQIMLVTPDDETEVMGFEPDERVRVVGKGAAVGREPGKGKSRTGGKGKSKAKGKPESPTPEAAATAKTRAPKKGRRQQPTEGVKKLSAIDAAAKVLAGAGTAMNCQELIKAMAEQGLWISPGGKTPSATLYSSILRELQTKGNEARFKKTERGKFEATNSRG